MPSIRKALALSFASKYSALAIHTAAVIVLARLLTPVEIGVYSVAAAVVALAHVLRDFGVGNYLIQEKELTTDRIRTAFGVTLAIGWTMAALIFAVSGLTADFYDEPGLREVLRVQSLNFIIIPFGSPILGLLMRDMAFGRIYVVEVASAIAHLTTGITLAMHGFGFMSLAWASLAGVVMSAAVAVLHSPKVAHLLPSFKEWRRVVRFGGQLSVASLLSQFGWKATDLIIGRVLGFEALGLYSRAAGLWSLFNHTIMDAVLSVMTPAFANKQRAGEGLLDSYLKGLSYVTVIVWPIYAFLGFMAYPVIRVLFGDQWDGAVPLFQLLCLAAFIHPFSFFVQPIFVATGQIRRLLISQAIIQPISVIIILAAAFHSLYAVAMMATFIALISFLVSYICVRDLIGLSVHNISRSVLKSLVVSLCSSVAPVAVYIGIEVGPDNSWEALLMGTFGMAFGWITSVYMLKHRISGDINLFCRRTFVRLR